MAVRRGISAHLRRRPSGWRCPVLDRLSLRRPRRDGHPDRRPEGSGAAARHLRLSRRARGPQWRRHLPRRHRAHRDSHVVADRLEHAVRRFGTHCAIHLRHRPGPGCFGAVAGRGRCALGRHRHGPAGLWEQRCADRFDYACHDAGRAQHRHAIADVSGAGSAVIVGTSRQLDGSAGRGAGQRRG